MSANEELSGSGGGWIEWGGGECPVAEGVPVYVWLRDETEEEANASYSRGVAGGWHWGHSDDCGDIIAYRIVGA